MTFAQSVYLIFTSVYVCKETVEHILLSSGEGHHHHHGDEVTSVLGCVAFNRYGALEVFMGMGEQDRLPCSLTIYHPHFAPLDIYLSQ